MAKQGPWATLGSASADGARIALEQAGGKALDRPVEMIWLDDPSPQGAAQNFAKAVEQEKVVAVIGGNSSASGLAMSAVAKEKKVPLIVHGAAATEITGEKCHRFVFRNNATVPAYSRMLAGPAASTGAKKWHYVVGAYAFGRDVHKEMREQLAAFGASEVGYDEIPVGTTDFSALTLKITSAKADGVVCGLAGNDLSSFLKQFAEFGLKDTVQLAGPAVGDEDLWGLELNSIAGMWGKLWHYANPSNPPEDADLNNAVTKLKGRPASQTEYMGWLAMRLALAGIQQAGDAAPEAIVRGLETVKLQSGFRYRDWDHQLVSQAVIVKAKPNITSKYDAVEVVVTEPKSLTSDQFYGAQSGSACRMTD